MKNIGIFGLGVVGQGFVEILKRNPNNRNSIKRAVVRDPSKTRHAFDFPISYDPESILHDDEIEIVVELTDSNEEAYEIAKATLIKGKALISANKKMLAENLGELTKLAKEYGGRLWFEAAAAGSIPLIQSVENYYRHDELFSFEGILNGSCNYILTQMESSNLSFDEALEKAKELGFAESDPSSDVEGWDTAYKLILTYFLFTGKVIRPSEVNVNGITNIGLADIENARARNKRIKLVGRFDGTSESPMVVEPIEVDQESALFAVQAEYNAVRIESKNAGVQLLLGKGAGSLPTGYAVYGDLLKAKVWLEAKHEKQNLVLV